MLKEELIKIIEKQRKTPLKKDIIKRDTKLDFKTDQIVIISGIRRCGKSTLLKNALKDKDYNFLTFEDPRLLKFEVEDFIKLEDLFKSKIYLFDEIQNIDNWESYIRSAHDNNKKIFITGSNATMLSKELGTKLTGRYKLIELFPFSYNEYLRFKKLEPSLKTFERYLEDGGFPEYLRSKEDEYLQRLVENIIARDIIVRNNIKNESTIYELANFILSNVAKIFSYNKISKKLGIKSVRTTIDYCNYLEESYLIESITQYSQSISKQLVNPKKTYAIDTGLIRANTLSFSKDKGRILENAVYLHLRRMHKKIHYFLEDNECDFLIKEKNSIIKAIQVCYNLNQDNLKREIDGLKEAMKKTKCKKGIIITLDQEDKIDDIKIIPVWKWMSE